MGEGAGVLVIESEESARRRGARVLAEIKAMVQLQTLTHLTAPHPEGEGGFRAMIGSQLHELSDRAHQYVNAHGTVHRWVIWRK